MKVMFGEFTKVTGSPVLISEWLKAQKDSSGKYHIFPKDAVIQQGIYMMNIPTEPTEKEIEELCAQVESLQRAYLVEQLKNYHKGSYIKLCYKKTLSIPGVYEDKCYRIVDSVVRLGINYTNLSTTAKSIGSTKLPWGTWDKRCPFFIINGEDTYLRCNLSKSPKHHKEEEYFDANNKHLTLTDLSEEVADKLEKANKGTPVSVFTLNINKILSIKGE